MRISLPHVLVNFNLTFAFWLFLPLLYRINEVKYRFLFDIRILRTIMVNVYIYCLINPLSQFTADIKAKLFYEKLMGGRQWQSRTLTGAVSASVTLLQTSVMFQTSRMVHGMKAVSSTIRWYRSPSAQAFSSIPSPYSKD